MVQTPSVLPRQLYVKMQAASLPSFCGHPVAHLHASQASLRKHSRLCINLPAVAFT